MLARDYLNLSVIRLNRGEHWTPANDCLTFVFPTEGRGCLTPPAPSPLLKARNHGSAARPAAVDHASASGNDLAVGDVLVLNGVGHGMLRNSAVRSAFKFSTFSLCLEHLFPLFAGRDVAMLGTVTERFRVPKHYPGDSSVAMACHGFLEDLPPRFDIDHRSQLLRAASAVLALELKNARTRHTGYVRIEEHISNVLETLSVTDIQHGTVHELARKFSCTPRHLNRLFHRHFGYSVAAFKMELRLLKAASLLCDPSAKVIRVAEECGFNFLGQFNTCFKRRFKLSPGEWRKGKAGLPPPHAKTVDGDGSCRMMALGLCPWIGKGITDTRSLSCR